MNATRIAVAASLLVVFSQGDVRADLTFAFAMNEASWLGSAPQVIDSSGNGHGGTVSGGANTVADSMFGRVGSFDGSGQYVNVGGSGTSTGARTYVAWVNFTANSLANGIPILTGGATFAGDFFGIAGTGLASYGVLQDHLYIDHWGNAAPSTSSIAVTPGQWNFVAVSYNGAGQVSYYVNGQAAGTVSGNLYNYNINTYTVGGNLIGGTSTVGSYEGSMANVSVYSTALSSSQIEAIYTASAVPEPSSLVLGSISGLIVVAAALRRGRSHRDRRS